MRACHVRMGLTAEEMRNPVASPLQVPFSADNAMRFRSHVIDRLGIVELLPGHLTRQRLEIAIVNAPRSRRQGTWREGRGHSSAHRLAVNATLKRAILAESARFPPRA